MSDEENFGSCALCLQVGLLKDSHLTPKWVYRRLRHSGDFQDDPVCVAGGSAFMTSKQVKKYLLCGECERRFSSREDYVARLTDCHPTKILEYVTIVGESMVGAVELNCKKINASKLSYFAISVIWRSCFIEGGCRLGKYEENFRKYLLGEDDFPNFAALTMTIINPAQNKSGNVHNMYTQPSSGRAGLLWFHGFSMFGLVFRCFVGQALKPEWKHLCLAGSNMRKYALLQTADECANHRGAVDKLINARPRGKLQKNWSQT